MGEPTPGAGENASVPSQKEVMEEAAKLRSDFTDSRSELRSFGRVLAMDRNELQDEVDIYRPYIEAGEAVRSRLAWLRDKWADTPEFRVKTAEGAKKAVEVLETREALLSAYQLVQADLNSVDSDHRADPDLASLSSKIQEAEKQLPALELKDENTILKAKQHFRDNEIAYKTAAVADAKAAGVEVEYPSYTEPKPQAEQPLVPAQPDVFPSPTPES